VPIPIGHDHAEARLDDELLSHQRRKDASLMLRPETTDAYMMSDKESSAQPKQGVHQGPASPHYPATGEGEHSVQSAKVPQTLKQFFEHQDAYLRTKPGRDLTLEEKERILHEAWRIHKLGANPLAILEREAFARLAGWKGADPSRMLGPKAVSRVDDFLPALEAGRLNEIDWHAFVDLLVKLILDAKHGYDQPNELYDSSAAANAALKRLLVAMKGKRRPNKLAKFQRRIADERTRPQREEQAAFVITVLKVRRACRQRGEDPHETLFQTFKEILANSARRQGREIHAPELARQANESYTIFRKFLEKHGSESQIRRYFGLLSRPDRARGSPKSQ